MAGLIARLEEAALALLLAAMTVLTFVQVVLRYFFNAGLIWALEATVYLFAWLIMIGISYAVRVHAHIGVDFVVKQFPTAIRRTIGLVAVGLCLLYALLMTLSSYWYLVVLGRLGIYAEDIPMPRWLLGIILPIGFALLFFRLLEQGWRILKREAEGFELADEARAAIEESGLLAREDAPGGRP